MTDPDYAAWAKKHAAANAKLEDRELPEDYERSEDVEKFLQIRAARAWCAPSEVTYGSDAV